MENFILYHGIGYELSMSGLTRHKYTILNSSMLFFSLGACGRSA